MLCLDVEFLAERCVANNGVAAKEPEWPPRADRMFSALVAAWGAHQQPAEETAALEWLERQAAPSIHASGYKIRDAPNVYVPHNDVRPGTLDTLAAFRRRLERRFPTAIPDDPLMAFCWRTATPNAAVFAALQSLADATPYLGHSSSLVRFWFHQNPRADDDLGVPSSTWVFPGRLAQLETAFRAGQRPSAAESVPRVRIRRKPPAPASVFGAHWIVLADAGGARPNIRGAAVATHALRTMLLSGFQGEDAPEVISGHAKDGQPSAQPHMAIFPLAYVGRHFADGHLMGLAICLPRAVADPDEQALFRAIKHLQRARPRQGRGRAALDVEADLVLGLPDGQSWRLVRQPDPQAASLKPERYTATANTWASVTPIVLDRHLRFGRRVNQAQRHAEIVALLRRSCTHIGLPEPRSVVPSRYSTIRASPAARRSPTSPPWMRWNLPGSFAGRQLTHATLTFDQPVQGPVALGAARFFGMGLCLPVELR